MAHESPSDSDTTRRSFLRSSAAGLFVTRFAGMFRSAAAEDEVSQQQSILLPEQKQNVAAIFEIHHGAAIAMRDCANIVESTARGTHLLKALSNELPVYIAQNDRISVFVHHLGGNQRWIRAVIYPPSNAMDPMQHEPLPRDPKCIVDTTYKLGPVPEGEMRTAFSDFHTEFPCEVPEVCVERIFSHMTEDGLHRHAHAIAQRYSWSAAPVDAPGIPDPFGGAKPPNPFAPKDKKDKRVVPQHYYLTVHSGSRPVPVLRVPEEGDGFGKPIVLDKQMWANIKKRALGSAKKPMQD